MSDIETGTLYQTPVDDAQTKEATASETLPTGAYTFQCDRYEAKKDDREDFKNGKGNPRFGIEYAHLFGKCWNTERKGKIGFDVSWVVVRNIESGKMDKQSKLWGQLCKALDGGGKTVGDVLDAAKSYPVNVFITESFRTEGNDWVNPKTDEERAECFRQGMTPFNGVQSISKVKGDTVPF